ncbi:MAG: hypothetical protein ACFFCS_05185 [Candidatus Hodarchaeota archaeon]
MYPNRSEALRMAAWKFLHESVRILKSISRAREDQSQGQDVPGLDELEEEDEVEDGDDDLSDLLELAHPA